MAKLKKNEFACFICQKIRLRGVYVLVKTGQVVKVCKGEKCCIKAKAMKINYEYNWGGL